MIDSVRAGFSTSPMCSYADPLAETPSTKYCAGASGFSFDPLGSFSLTFRRQLAVLAGRRFRPASRWTALGKLGLGGPWRRLGGVDALQLQRRNFLRLQVDDADAVGVGVGDVELVAGEAEAARLVEQRRRPASRPARRPGTSCTSRFAGSSTLILLL